MHSLIVTAKMNDTRSGTDQPMPFQTQRSSCSINQRRSRTASSILCSSISMNIRVSHQENQKGAG